MEIILQQLYSSAQLGTIEDILSILRSFVMTLIILLIVVAIIGFFILTYNRLISQIESVRNNQKQIDIQLDRRFKVFESLINVVKNIWTMKQPL